MENGNNNYELSKGAVELLRIACENDEHQAIANNPILIASLNFGEQLVVKCRDRSIENKLEALGIQSTPRHFLEFAGVILKHIRTQTDKQINSGKISKEIQVVNDFDRHVLQGFADSLADIIKPNRSKDQVDNFEGPSLEICLIRLAETEIEELFRTFIKNYTANILQYYFSAAHLETSVPPKTVFSLRDNDSQAIAGYVIQQVSGSENEVINASSVLKALQKTFSLFL